MDVLLRNVPVHLSDDGLKRELTPFMNALGIVEFHCEKPMRKAQASITFLNEYDGKKFLHKHEKVQSDKNQRPKGPLDHKAHRPRAIARLFILKTAIFVERGKRQVDEFVLSALRYEKEQRKALPEKNPRSPPFQAHISQIACGKIIYEGTSDVLKFIQQTSFKCRHENIAQFGRRYFTLTLGEWRMDVPYSIIQELIADHKASSLAFVLTETPRFYEAVNPDEEGASGFEKWRRKASIGMWKSHAKYVAGCLVYRIGLYGNQFNEVINQLKNRDQSVTRHPMPISITPEPNKEDFTTCMSVFLSTVNNIGSQSSAAKRDLLPYAIIFQVHSLVSMNYLHPAMGTEMLKAMIQKAMECEELGQPPPFTTQAMRILHQTIPYPVPGTEPRQLQVGALVDAVIAHEVELRNENMERTKIHGAKIASHQAWVLKATVTPTRIMFNGPDAESMNRVLRMFSDHIDHFLRVTFCDEDGQDLPYNPRISNKDIFERYRKVLKDGIKVAGRHFSFLGFSHSSLRSHSAWFSAKFWDSNGQCQDSDTIIRSLGDFSLIRIPAKCAARIGQAFSETPFEVNLDERRIKVDYITDVKSKDGTRVFSDGVGTISRAAMEEIWNEIPRKRQTPTCFQIRLGGVKGMLSLDSRLKGKIICIRRESMMKFESRDTSSLGICDTASQPLRMFLNRQSIKILEDMGTDDSWFINQQSKALRVLRAVTATASNTSTFLEYQDVNTNVGLPRFIKLLDKLNINYRRDKFMRALVEHIVLRELRLLKHKARIPVDKGVTLFGIMDETGFLKEGEIYVTFDGSHDKAHGRVKGSLKDGSVIVTRSPALNPGDIQYVKMKTPPPGHPLRHLQNCIVFSQKGARDLPSQLSGGDLDGDLYNVIWDPEARPKRQFTPADYPRVAPKPLDRVVKREDIADFFVKFMETDILGLIASRHQILADIKPDGTLNPQCIELAELHSTAVDYSKTGIPVSIQSLPKATRTRPDFLAPAPPVKLYDLGQIDHILDRPESEDEGDGMGMAKHRFHKSEKILGRLFRGIDEQKIWNEEISRPINLEGPSVWEQLLGRVAYAVEEQGYGPGEIDYQRRMTSAWHLRNMYDNAMRDHMWHFSENPRMPLTEVEVFCGSIFKKMGSQTRRERDSSVKLKETMDEHMAMFMRLIRDRTMNAEDALPSMEGDGGERERMNAVELCWACVVVGGMRQINNPDMAYRETMELESFRVVAACCLAKELSDLLGHSGRMLDSGGGYLGVSAGGQQQHMVLPMR